MRDTLLILVAVGAAACSGEPFQWASDTGGGAGTGGSSGTGGIDPDATAGTGGGGGQEPGCPGVCVAVVPAGWLGPVVVHEGDAPLPCVGDYPNERDVVHHEVVAAPAECACACTTKPAAGQAELVSFADTGCTTPCQSFALPNGLCTTLSNIACPGPPSAWHVATPGYCEAAPTEVVMPWRWKSATTVCGTDLVDLDSCDEDNACVPKPPGDPPRPLCIVAQTETDCPSSYPNKLVRFHDAEDLRRCPPCACEPSSPLGTVKRYLTSACTATAGHTDSVPTGCIPWDYAWVGFEYTRNASTPACTPRVPPTPEGAVEPRGAVTICCEP